MRAERLIEGAWPYCIALSMACAWWLSGSPFPRSGDGLLAASGTAAAVLIGFLSTAKAVLLGLSGSPAMKALKTAGFLSLFYRYIFEAIWAATAFLIIVTIGFFWGDKAGVPWAYAAVWVGTAALVMCLYTRVTHLFFILMGKV